MKNWRPVDFIVAALTVAVSSIMMVSVLAYLWTGTALSDSRAELLQTVVTSAVSVVSMYVGAAIQRRADEGPKP